MSAFTKRIISSVCLVSAILYFTSCSEEINCPAFPQEELNWLPYQNIKTLTFTNGIDTVTYNMEKFYSSEPYSYDEDCDCYCVANAIFETLVNEQNNWKLEGEVFHNEGAAYYEYRFAYFEYENGVQIAQRMDKLGFFTMEREVEDGLMPEFQVDENNFTNVVEVELDTIPPAGTEYEKPHVWRLYVAENIGIVRYDNRFTGETWTIITN